MAIDLGRLLLEAGPLEPGAFFIQKCIFIEEGKNINNGERCENLSYGGVGVVLGTPYEGETWELRVKSQNSDFELTVSELQKWGHVVSVVPHFFIDFIQIKQIGVNGGTLGPPDLQLDPTPMTMWFGRSIYQLFKTLREWSFMVDEPFNSDHPMAIYSKMAYDVLGIPQNILQEIDAMPDMHLAKFLKGQDDYKIIPPHPVISQEFKQWILDTCAKYPDLSFEERLEKGLQGE
jgi:hypothetical protein